MIQVLSELVAAAAGMKVNNQFKIHLLSALAAVVEIYPFGFGANLEVLCSLLLYFIGHLIRTLE